MRLQPVLGVVLYVGVLVAPAMLSSSQQETQAGPEQAADAARGKMVFEHRCTGCHAMDVDREGPRLRTVYGRKAGSVAGFEYSASLPQLGLTWNADTLDRWLTDPDAMVPGNNMSFPTPKAADRRDLIAYLQEAGGRK
jgi:cytochrome c